MKTKTRLVPILLACATAAQTAPLARCATRVDDVLYAIRQVESGDRYFDCPIGRHGEQGPYQFRREVWRQYTRAPFRQARTGLADTVALRHYSWLLQELQRGGLEPTVWQVAAAWNGGVEAVLSGRLAPATRDYANRVVNIVESEVRLRAALTPTYRVAFAQNN